MCPTRHDDCAAPKWDARADADVGRSAPRLILASASPRRAQLLREAGYTFDVRVPPLAEPEPHTTRRPPSQHAEASSYFKASAVARSLDTGIVVGADTVVALGDQMFGKAADADDARRILRTLAGTRHSVITGVTIIDAATGRRAIRHAVTFVSMRPMTPEGLEAYVASGGWAGKAGAYGIQDHGDAFVERIEGSFSNVVGLPMELLAEMLEAFGVRPGSRGRT